MLTKAQPAEVIEVPNEGLVTFLDKDILLFGLNYIYAGKLTGVNDTFVKIEGAKLVYETGAFTVKGYHDAQVLPSGTWYVQRSAIESFGPGK